MASMEYNDLWLILEKMEPEKAALLPEKYREFVQQNMVPGAVSQIDPTVSLHDQEVSDKTKLLLATLILTYWAADPADRWRFAEKLHANELKFQGKPQTKMTEADYQELLKSFDDWNDYFGPIPYWTTSRKWYPLRCYEIAEDVRDARVWAGNTGLKEVYVSQKEREQILEEAREWVLVKEINEKETLFWHEDDTYSWQYTETVEDYYRDRAVIKDGHFMGTLILTESVYSFGMQDNHYEKWGILYIDGSKDGTTDEFISHNSTEVDKEKTIVYSLRKK